MNCLQVQLCELISLHGEMELEKPDGIVLEGVASFRTPLQNLYNPLAVVHDHPRHALQGLQL